MPALTNLHGLLGLIWLSPQDPNFLDRTFGRFANQEFNRDNSVDIALLMVGLLLLALLWRGLRQRKFDLLGDGQAQTLIQRVGLEPVLAKPAVLQWGNRVVTAALVVVALLASVNYFYGTRNDGTCSSTEGRPTCHARPSYFAFRAARIISFASGLSQSRAPKMRWIMMPFRSTRNDMGSVRAP